MPWIAVPYASKLEEEETEEKGEVIFVGFICPMSLPRSYEAACWKGGSTSPSDAETNAIDFTIVMARFGTEATYVLKQAVLKAPIVHCSWTQDCIMKDSKQLSKCVIKLCMWVYTEPLLRCNGFRLQRYQLCLWNCANRTNKDLTSRASCLQRWSFHLYSGGVQFESRTGNDYLD